MSNFLELALQQFQQQSLLELIAVVLSVLYVVFAARQNIWCWPCAFISTAIFAYLFWEVSLIYQIVLYFYYIVMAIFGYLSWRKTKDNTRLTVTRISLKNHLVLLALGFSITLVLTLIGQQWFTSSWVWLDAGTAVFSVIATVMTVRKKIDNWVYWFILNPVSGYLMFVNGLYLTCLLMVFYTAMSVYGFLNWRKELTTS